MSDAAAGAYARRAEEIQARETKNRRMLIAMTDVLRLAPVSMTERTHTVFREIVLRSLGTGRYGGVYLIPGEDVEAMGVRAETLRAFGLRYWIQGDAWIPAEDVDGPAITSDPVTLGAILAPSGIHPARYEARA